MNVAERQARSALARLVTQRGVLRGNLSQRRRACGKPTCKCARGELHQSLYLVFSEGGKLREWHCRASLLIAESLWTQQGCPQFPTRIVHQGVTVSSSFEHAGFDTTRAIGDFVGGDPLQSQMPQLSHVPARPRRQ